IVVLLGPAERAQQDAWRATGHRVLTDLSLIGVMRWIAAGSLWLGNDSGPSHLAGALGKRGVVLFRPARAQRWRPRGGALQVVESKGRPIDVVARDVLIALNA